MWCRWQLIRLVSSAALKYTWHKPSNYQVTTATASEYIWTFRALTRRLSHAMGLQYLFPKYEFLYHQSTVSILAQPFSFSNRNSGRWTKLISFAVEGPWDLLLTFPGVSTRLTHQYLSMTTQDLTGKQIMEILKHCPHHLSSYSSVPGVKTRCYLNPREFVSDGDPTISQDRLNKS